MTKRFSFKALVALVLALSMILAMTATSLAYKTLRYRSKGAEVSAMQQALKDKGYYTGKVDGSFGGGTLAAVRAFQKDYGLIVDGCAGNNTLQSLYGGPIDVTKTDEKGQTAIGKIPSDPSTLYYTCKGTRVTTLQKALKKLGYYKGEIDGSFGDGTLKAVLAFQRDNGLSMDGWVGTKTAAKITQKSKTKLTLSSTLAVGSKGDSVKKLQTQLYKLGFYNGGDTYGEFGTNTATAVNAFQSKTGETPTGYVTQKMYTRIMGYTGGGSGQTYTTLRKGMTSTAVAELNAKLISLGYAAPAGYEYTDETVEAVKNFQRTYNLDVDGVAGPKTREKLASL